MFYLSFQLGEKISVNFEFCECKHREPLPSLRSLCWKILCLSGFQENSPLCWTIQGSNTDLDWFLHIELKKQKFTLSIVYDRTRTVRPNVRPKWTEQVRPNVRSSCTRSSVRPFWQKMAIFAKICNFFVKTIRCNPNHFFLPNEM